MLTTAEEPLHFPSVPPTPPTEAEKTIEALHGFKMQLIAAEPLVCDPVALTYDEDGRAFVCEMSDYPYTDKAHHKASQENPTDQAIGKVRLLVDTDGDGVFDKATVFADGLSWPTGAACWKGGIIVVATPDIWYLKDTDGDGVADVRQKLFTGLKKLNIQAVANNPIWGLDNKIYIAGGSNGGTLQNLVHPEEKPLTFRRNDLILDPVKMTIELASGGARFGNTRDDWGNRFLCNIRNPLEHVVIEQRYLARNPYLPPVNPLNDVAESGDQLPVYRISPPEQWREFRAKRWTGDSTVASHMPKSELVGSGVVTSSSGCTIYRGDAYPKEFYGNAFVADVAGNLFYRLALTPDGVTFKGTRVDGKKEMVASRDIWFRPVNFANAPDGTLTVCDMYREVIEHPWSLPDDIHAALDLERGRDMGRLYRLAPPESSLTLQSRERSAFNKSHAPGSGGPSYKAPQLSKASTAELVALLAHPNAWHRDTAQRLLFERQDQSSVEPLRAMVQTSLSAQGKVAALWSLAGMNALGKLHPTTLGGRLDTSLELPNSSVVPGNGRVLLAAMADADAHVREHAAILSQGPVVQPFKEATPPVNGFGAGVSTSSGGWLEIAYALQKLVQDKSMRVRVEAVEASRDYKFGFGGSLLQHMLGMTLPVDGNDQWARTRLLASNTQKIAGTMLPRMITRRLDKNSAVSSELLRDLCDLVVRSKDVYSLKAAIGNLDRSDGDWNTVTEVMAFVGRAMTKTGWLWKDVRVREEEKTATKHNLAAYLDRLKNDLTKQSADPSVSSTSRALCLNALSAMLNLDEIKTLTSPMLAPGKPVELQRAALDALVGFRDPSVANVVINAWPALTPAPRESVVQSLISQPSWTEALLSAIEQGRIKPAEISATARTLLSKNANVKVRERSANLFGGSGSRAEAIAKYQSALTLKADAAAGHKVYQTVCAACHRKGDEGRDIGPNLATIMSWTSEQMLTNILDPNREVSPNFLLYIVETNDGRTLSGLITSETPTSVALKGADGVEQSVARSEVRSLKSAGISLMPEGLEATITPQQMADLMAFLKS